MKKLVFLDRPFSTASAALLLVLATSLGGCKRPSNQAPSVLNTDEEKAIYSLGFQVGQSLRGYSLTPIELAIVKSAIDDSAAGKEPKVDPNAYRQKVGEMMRARQVEIAAAEKTRGQAALEKAAAEQGAEKTASGMVFKSIKEGSEQKPTAEDTVKVHYEGRLTDGTVFDSSYKRNTPTEFPLRGVIKCWTEGVQKMGVGAKARLTCPFEIAYGERGKPPTIPGNATLVFDIELLEIVKR